MKIDDLTSADHLEEIEVALFTSYRDLHGAISHVRALSEHEHHGDLESELGDILARIATAKELVRIMMENV